MRRYTRIVWKQEKIQYILDYMHWTFAMRSLRIYLLAGTIMYTTMKPLVRTIIVLFSPSTLSDMLLCSHLLH